MKNILIVWDRIGDYHLARINAVKSLITNNVVYSADLAGSDNLYKWNVGDVDNHFILSNKPAEKYDILKRFKNFVSILKKNKIKYCCLAGYGRIEYLLFIVWSKISGRKVLLFSESWYGSRTFGNILKSWFLRLFADKFLVSGIRAKNFAENVLKIKVENINTPYSVIDNQHFENKLGYNPNHKIMLCMARFSKEKNQEMLINAFIKSKLSKTWKLKLVGAGPLKDNLIKQTENYDNIIISDWASYDKLPEIYSQSSFFVLASTFEPWGLVVNEAMSAGLPIACSECVGCAPDLVSNKNGFIFNSSNINSMIDCFDKISELSEPQLIEMSNQSLKTISDYTPKIWAENLLNLLNYENYQHC
ncbi:MAG: glycosyltransferase family 4 protein [Bacteroidales bacterium]|nr:glycosyltransferase family 4 protein [Bacteroidales bacterium]